MPTTITNISLVLDAFLTKVKANHITGDTLPIVASPQLDYEAGLRDYRARNKMNLGDNLDATRVFMFTRDPLRFSDHGPGRRSFKSLETNASLPTSVDIIKSVFAVLPIRWMFATKNMAELEAFELGYITGDGIKSIKEFDTTFPVLGETFTHYVHWERDLESLELRTHEESFRQTVTGTARIEGWWMVLRDEESPSPIIQEIATLIQNPELVVFDSDLVVPDASP